MQRANDSGRQTIEEMRQTVQTLAQRVNQLERLLDGKEIREAKVDEGTVYQRGIKLSLSNGMIAPAWNIAEIIIDDAISNLTIAEVWDRFAFGFTIAGAVVTVNAGKVRHGTRTPITVAQTNVTIGADNTYVFCAYTFGSGAASISSSTSEPVDTEEVHNHILYLVTLTGGVASIGAGNIRHLGDVFIPGAFA